MPANGQIGTRRTHASGTVPSDAVAGGSGIRIH